MPSFASTCLPQFFMPWRLTASPAVASALPVGADIKLMQLGVGLLKAKRDLDAIIAQPDPQDEDVGTGLLLDAADLQPDGNDTGQPGRAGCRRSDRVQRIVGQRR